MPGARVRRPPRPARRLPHRRGRVPPPGGPPRRRARSRPTWTELLDYTERLTRAVARASCPTASGRFEDWIDDDGIDYGKPIRLFVTLRKPGDSLVADWTGTSPQVKGAINNTAVVHQGGDLHVPQVRARPRRPVQRGLLPRHRGDRAAGDDRQRRPPRRRPRPAASPASACSTRCFGALAQMLPDRGRSPPRRAANTGVSIGGYYPDRRPFIFVEFICSAWGGRAWADGLDGNANMLANMSLPPVEITEAEQPLQILCTEFIQDVGGPGKYRGGMSIRRDYKLLAEEAVLQVRADRHDVPPVRALRGPSRPAGPQRAQPGTGRERAAREAHDDDEPGRRLPPRAAGTGRLGRSPRARPGAGAARTSGTSSSASAPPATTTVW